ncbi:ABC-2 type transport system permease protein [Halobiforma haloterrestris]|uniref:ABC-2 type transport system permease protein n=1 Tax=Natronobacterium haloterrestre TaxID=148448 RepID=A0A1I1EEU5_NATHA|nr:ABC transporter permease subunit [Halobiforma haloterrestris]SFB83490.1 ABC-2 type transport system permease protein [Halobiforma haloterrestris]
MSPEPGEKRAATAAEAQREPSTPSTGHRLWTIVDRELHTVARTRTFYLLAAALAAVVLGITWIGDGFTAGYLPTTVDLLTPLELLVPIVAVAFGYRAILGDELRGELDVLETYPVSPREIVLGVYAGRAVGVAVAIAVPLALAAVGIALGGEDPVAIYATHTGADSPILFARFLVLTVLFGLVLLAVAIAISALVGGTRSALALAVVALVALLIGFDLALVYGLAEGVIGDADLLYSLAISPLSAYRGLVLETTVVVASGTGPRVASPLASLVGLAAWTVGSLAVAIWGVRR